MGLLYKNKIISDYGFVVLCPSLNIENLKNTVESINLYYETSKVLVVIPEECDPKVVSKIRNLSQIVIAKNNLVSMVNKGMELALSSSWNFIIHRHSWVKDGILKRFSSFIESEKDILFPINRRNWNFSCFDLNGFLITKETFTKIGGIPEEEDGKLVWADNATKNGCVFKGINGAFLN